MFLSTKYLFSFQQGCQSFSHQLVSLVLLPLHERVLRPAVATNWDVRLVPTAGPLAEC
jgi:hypothetical protein